MGNKEFIIVLIRLFIVFNLFMGVLFFWFHAPKIFGIG